MADALTYFNKLPSDVLSNIFRIVYRCLNFEDGGGVSLLFSELSVFRTIVSSIFTKLEFDNSKLSFNVAQDTLKFDIEKLAESNSGEMQALNACGASVRTIKFIDYKTYAEVIPTTILVECCPNIEALEFWGIEVSTQICSSYNELVREVGPQLRTLWWWCEKVEHLDLSRCVSLRELTYRGGKLQVLAPNWKTIGPTLRKLNIRTGPSCASWSDSLTQIQESARNLTHIEFSMYPNIKVSKIDADKYASFLASYGETLIKADVTQLGNQPDNLYTIAQACPNCDFYYRANDEREKWKAVSVLGSRLKDLKIELFFPQTINLNVFQLAMANCLGLYKLDIVVGYWMDNELLNDIVSGIFSSSRRTIQELWIGPMIVSSRSLELIASRTSNLKVFRIIAVNGIDIHTANAFQSIVESNPFLEQFSLHEFYPLRPYISSREMTRTVEIVEQISQCISNSSKLCDVFLDLISNQYNTRRDRFSGNLRDRILSLCIRFRNRGVGHRIRLFRHGQPFSANY